MTVREELIREIEQTSDDVLELLLSFLRQARLSNSKRFSAIEPASISSAGLTQKHYPLRGMPLVIAEDFDEPMSDLWDALGK
ncbi:MAG: hypothetical protein HC789_22340 [Microcoleus sp. CSU_2_2]|nr:hypothetical protein [Microcoleus sp. SU_5_3]NJS12909.1 hypothetical protein [Microcoleus sp. CSU_2_2]